MRFIQGRNKANRWKGSRSGAEPRGPEDCEEGYEFVRRHTEKDGTFVHAYCRRIERKEKADVKNFNAAGDRAAFRNISRDQYDFLTNSSKGIKNRKENEASIDGEILKR